jgi:NADH-quinone oxidoreductase subunit M
MFGPLSNHANQGLKDLNARELAYLAPLVVLIFVMGLFPQVFFDRINPSVDRFLARMESRYDGSPYAELGNVPSWVGVIAGPPHAAPAHGEGHAAPAHGEAPPAHGEAAPAHGEAAPAHGEAAPAEAAPTAAPAEHGK